MKEKKDTKREIRTRFAPSPTGGLHIGGARTALFKYLFAKKNKGKFFVRIEDTDQKRYVKDADKKILEMLEWLGLSWEKEVLYQSSRLSLYKEYARELIKNDKAYYCFCSEERLEKARKRQQEKNIPTGYDGFCRNLPTEKVLQNIKEGKSHVVRLKTPKKGNIKFKDLIRGNLEFDLANIDDQVLMKSDGYPTYHLASIVDDYEQGITHVLRGEEWLSSTPKHLLLYKFFGWDPPLFGHLPIVIGKDRKKLSKREGAVSIEEFKSQGYLAESLVNFMVLLGWNYGSDKELFSLEELERFFSIEKINKSPAIFDRDKLNYFNGYYIRNCSDKDLFEHIAFFSRFKLVNKDEEYIKKIIKVVRNRITTLKDFDGLSFYFFKKPDYKKDLLKFKKSLWGDTKKGLRETINVLKNTKESAWNSEGLLQDIIARVVEKNNLNNGDVFWPIRVALSGEEKSPSPVELLWVLGKKESLKRLNIALEKV